MDVKFISIPFRASVGTLVLAIATFQLGNGFLGTLVSLRVNAEAFLAGIEGVVLASYYVGYTLGALRAGPLIHRIGHIRAFAAFAGGAAASTLVMPLLITSWSWIAARLVIGFCAAGLFVATESWLNAKAEPATRGQVFAFYMVALYAAAAFGQLLVGTVDFTSIDAFNLVACLFAVALVVVSTTHAEPPALHAPAPLPLARLVRAAPVAVAGCALASMASGIFYTLGPVWALAERHSISEIGRFMFTAILGGLCLQPVIGRMSDRIDRRLVVAALAFGLAAMLVGVVQLPHHSVPWLVADFWLGGFLFTLYPVCVAHAVDRIGGDLVLEIGGRLVLISGVAAALGPIVGSQAVAFFGTNGFIYALALLPALLTWLIVVRICWEPAARRRKQQFPILSDQVPMPTRIDPADEEPET